MTDTLGLSPALLIRGGVVYDPAASGPPQRADVLVRDGVIVALGNGLEVPPGTDVIDANATLVAPGFVDTHRHLWSAPLRHIALGWDIVAYFNTVQRNWGAQFTPDDIYDAQLLGALSALNAGVTSIADESHIQNTPAHTDAAINALRDAGIRARFGYGWSCTEADSWFGPAREHPFDMERVRREVLADDDSLVTMQAMLRGPEMTGLERAKDDIQRARELGLRMTMHVGFGQDPGIALLRDAGLLGDDMLFIHGCWSTDDEVKAAVDAGASFSVAASTETVMPGQGIPATARILAAGGRPSLSIDTETCAGADMFTAMRAALAADVTAHNGRVAGIVEHPHVTVDDVLRASTAWGAQALNLPSGTIAVGAAADLITIRLDDLTLFPAADPLRSVVAAGNPGVVDTVMVGGRVVKSDGRLHADTATLRERILALNERLHTSSADLPAVEAR